MAKQLTLFKKTTKRKSKHDSSIRHRERPTIQRPSSMHLTIKIEKEKAGIKNKTVLAILKRCILKARGRGLKIIHFTLEYDHVHLLAECHDKKTLGPAMMVFGVTLAKGINKHKTKKGRVFKHRYHQRFIKSSRELKNVLNYIFKNGMKHRSAASEINDFNSLRAEVQYFDIFTKQKIDFDRELLSLLDRGRIYFSGIRYVM